MSKAKVSSLVRIHQGNNIVEFELLGDRLTIELRQTHREEGKVAEPSRKVTIGKDAVNVLREMLGPGMVGGGSTKLATKLPPDTTEDVPADSDKGPDFKAGMA